MFVIEESHSILTGTGDKKKCQKDKCARKKREEKYKAKRIKAQKNLAAFFD